MKTRIAGALSLALIGAGATAWTGPPEDEAVSSIRYEVTFDAETARERVIHVDMSFDVANDDVVALSLPRWTPGSYSLDEFAQNVGDVRATQNEVAIRWDKADFDTWRVHPTGRGRVTMSFDYAADQLDNGNAWTRPDFAFFNGTNVFLYPQDTVVVQFDQTVPLPRTRISRSTPRSSSGPKPTGASRPA